ncbi:MAG: hypothetical protein JO308_10810, partial [Verrucomicrobia bacterium]|nr:hypothetical protein [Verrucomicrobiota bacterium]
MTCSQCTISVALRRICLSVVVLLSGQAAALAQQNFPINHFIYIIQENHSFDNYFGTYPGANGIPIGTALPEHPGGPPKYRPFHMTALHIPRDLSHAWQAARTAYNDGLMNGFIWAEWPQALKFYWDGKPVPTPNPKLVHPLPTPTPTPVDTADDEDAPFADPQAVEPAASSNGPPAGPPPDYVLYTLSYVDYHEIPNYWEYAHRFTLCDEFFSSLMGP